MSALETVRDARLVMVCGSGGVGKTTSAAALGMVLASQGQRVLVVTVDPARRLAQALGLADIGLDEQTVPTIAAPGLLAVSMLDTKAGWDQLIRMHASDAASAERVIANPLYKNITERFVNSHDYIAMERLYELRNDNRYDIVVVDTPPSRNALDLLDAPSKMREFFGGRLLRWLTLPYRSRLLTVASRPFLQLADRVLGAQFLGDIGEFFNLLQSMEKGFIQRATSVENELRASHTRFVVVTTPDDAPAHEALFMVDELRRRSMSPALMMVNRSLSHFAGAAIELAAHVGHSEGDRIVTAVINTATTVASIGQRHQQSLERLSRAVPCVVVPESPPVSGRDMSLQAIATVLTGG